MATAAKILIVDDELPFRTGIRCYLADEGYTIEEADNGPAALKAFDQVKPDFVFLDLRMPKMSGLDVLRELRARSADTPVVMISGAGEIADVVESMRLRAWDFVQKPILDMRILREILHKGIDRLRLLRENAAYRLRLEEMIAERTAQLAAANTALERKAIALEEILTNYQAETGRRKTRLVERVNEFVRPMIESSMSDPSAALMQFDAALTDAAADSVDVISQKLSALSPAELRVCEKIRRGMGSKEIASEIGITADTVDTHRRNIRRKLRIKNESINLTTFLRQLCMDGAT